MSLFLLSSFLSSYKHLVRTFLYRKGKTDMEDVTSSLLSNKLRKNGVDDDSQAKASVK